VAVRAVSWAGLYGVSRGYFLRVLEGSKCPHVTMLCEHAFHLKGLQLSMFPMWLSDQPYRFPSFLCTFCC
jgi:hypothetical protein